MFHIWNLLGVAQKPPLTAPKGLLSKNSNCYAFEFVTSYLLLVSFQKLEFNWLPIDLSIIQRLFSRCHSATDHFVDLILITWVSLGWSIADHLWNSMGLPMLLDWLSIIGWTSDRGVFKLWDAITSCGTPIWVILEVMESSRFLLLFIVISIIKPYLG